MVGLAIIKARTVSDSVRTHLTGVAVFQPRELNVVIHHALGIHVFEPPERFKNPAPERVLETGL